jgi:hypothetical protein
VGPGALSHLSFREGALMGIRLIVRVEQADHELKREREREGKWQEGVTVTSDTRVYFEFGNQVERERERERDGLIAAFQRLFNRVWDCSSSIDVFRYLCRGAFVKHV